MISMNVIVEKHIQTSTYGFLFNFILIYSFPLHWRNLVASKMCARIGSFGQNNKLVF